MSERTLIAVDLFCGCGGISCGLQMAGVNVIAGVDVEAKYLATFKHNFPEAQAITTDITKLSPEEFAEKLNLERGELDILVGGPPCQGFSKNVPRKNRYLEDPRNQLIKAFLDYCEYLTPKIILLENVAEMKNGFDKAYSDEIIDRLKSLGYDVASVVLNSADFGVPQQRKRAFFVANRLGFPARFPKPTHSSTKDVKSRGKNVSLFDQPSYVNVWDAISDLRSLEHGKGDEAQSYASEPQSYYQSIMRNGNQIVKNHVARYLKDKQFQRLAYLKPGQGHKDLPTELQVASGYSGAYGRLTKDMIAPTITRWVFHPGSGRWGHPVDIRTLTMREVARIQSFPDSYEFVGSYNEQAGQLGNAVPPLLVKSIITLAISHLNQDLEAINSKSSSNEKISSPFGREIINS